MFPLRRDDHTRCHSLLLLMSNREENKGLTNLNTYPDIFESGNLFVADTASVHTYPTNVGINLQFFEYAPQSEFIFNTPCVDAIFVCLTQGV